jgi:hypothetical protein
VLRSAEARACAAYVPNSKPLRMEYGMHMTKETKVSPLGAPIGDLQVVQLRWVVLKLPMGMLRI